MGTGRRKEEEKNEVGGEMKSIREGRGELKGDEKDERRRD